MIDYATHLVEVKQLTGVLLMDNLPTHHNKTVKEIMINKNLNPIYTLPYSPELNPIEELFSIMKREARKHCIFGIDRLKKFISKLVARLNKNKSLFKNIMNTLLSKNERV